MKTQQEIEEQAAQALNSLDNLQPVEANAYLYSKIKNRMIQNRQTSVAAHTRLMFKLSAALLLFLCINVTSIYLLNRFGQPDNKVAGKNTATGIAAVSQEYFSTANSYSY
jgi:thiosulfate reductase cytochrome b subunit